MSFTIRQKTTNPIVTYRGKLWALFKTNPRAAGFAIAWHCQRYKELSGREMRLDWTQKQELAEAIRQSPKELPTGVKYMAYLCFSDGYMMYKWPSMEEAFQAAVLLVNFYDGV